MGLENDRDLIIALRQDVKHIQEILEDLTAEQRLCTRDHEERLKNLEIFQASVLATGIANEKSVTDTARKTATQYGLIIGAVTFVVTIVLDLWLKAGGGI